MDTELLVFRRVHKFARSGTLLKEIEVNEIRRVQGRNVAARMTLKDTLKRGSSTEFALADIEIEKPLPPKIFSLGELTW
ncbi:MAG: putative outer membrane protein involved in lipoprotein sorting [Parcubacteria group bacterium GW2011_GWB1_52_7]|nr:MAG: putative outer membrane protein involved in lipoprotein sorting [Parcubacteria group bacterium GW2011_GWB1_52_7]